MSKNSCQSKSTSQDIVFSCLSHFVPVEIENQMYHFIREIANAGQTTRHRATDLLVN